MERKSSRIMHGYTSRLRSCGVRHQKAIKVNGLQNNLAFTGLRSIGLNRKSRTLRVYRAMRLYDYDMKLPRCLTSQRGVMDPSYGRVPKLVGVSPAGPRPVYPLAFMHRAKGGIAHSYPL